MIKPTIGRVVWFWPGDNFLEQFEIYDADEPCSAQIAFVYDDTTVNLSVTDHAGSLSGLSHVLLWQGEGERPLGSFCEWMPYQKGQAAKTEALEAQAASKG